MQFKVVWSDRAQADLADICHYISENGRAAEALGLGIVDHAEHLKTSPELGTKFKKAKNSTIRSFVHGQYRVFYRVTPATRTAEIVHIRHGARKPLTKADFD